MSNVKHPTMPSRGNAAKLAWKEDAALQLQNQEIEPGIRPFVAKLNEDGDRF